MKRIGRARLISGCLGVLGLAGLFAFQNCAPAFEVSGAFQKSALSLSVATLSISSSSSVISSDRVQQFQVEVPLDRAKEVSQFTCQLDAAPAKPCDLTTSFSDLSDGLHTLTVTGLGSGGALIASGSYSFSVDTTGPIVSLNSFPVDVSGSTTLNAQFNAVDTLSGVDQFKCQVDAEPMAECTSPFSKPALTEGRHTFTVQAFDKVGNVSAIVSKAWTVSSKVPDLQLGAVAAFSGPTLSFTFTARSASGATVTSTCSLDGAAATSCAGVFQAVSLAEGPHAVVVQSMDAAGNKAMATANWVTDLTAPVVVITSKNALTSENPFRVTFTSTDAKSGVKNCECSANGGNYSACTDSFLVSYAKDGLQSATVKCSDAIGNVSQPVATAWTWDRTPPLLNFSTNQPALSGNTTATFNIQATDGVTKAPTIQVSLNDGPYTAVAPGAYTLTGLTENRYVLNARAVDEAGNTSQVSTFSWAVDTTAPTTPNSILVNLVSGFSLRTTFKSTDIGSGIASYEVKIGTTPGGDDLVTSTKTTSPSFDFYATNLISSPMPFFYVSVRATDRFAHVSEWGISQVQSYFIVTGYPGCVSGRCDSPSSYLDTSRATLQAGTIKSAGTASVITADDHIRMTAMFAQKPPYQQYLDQFGGAVSATCQFGSLPPAACDPNDVVIPPGVPQKTIVPFLINVTRNSEELFKGSFNLVVLPAAAQPDTVTTLARSVLFKKSISLSYNYNDRSEPDFVYVSPGVDVRSTRYTCGNASSGQCRVVVGNGGSLYLDIVNFFSPRPTPSSVYVGTGGVVRFRTSTIDTVYAAEGSLLLLEPYGLQSIQLLEASVTDPCAVPGGPACPVDTKVIQ
jgi:hypothetical protein